MMKKTTFGAVLAFLFAAAGALTAAALYLYHREKELDEYERLLFSDDYDDFDDEDDTDATTYETIHDTAKTEE
ncbi:phosphatase [Gemmiger formicilis]|uniref:phosphatase n=1 Tax=Gemmiger formicilis TaxID=745368 RepID=UPI00210C49F5|nr:phosphatase [Gemmiger formicilis]MCI6786887.1 phosphatase [Oscillospiraceae bacterium]MCQ5079551.1 phosphatase [Gemmiger formicilis]MCQ5115918.1 phosphatase [Gemmiger formicilis]